MVTYKSEYSKACDILGIEKPKTQEEEDYCLLVEFEHPETAAKVLSEMLNKKVTKDSFPNTFYKTIDRWIKLVK